MNNIMIVGVGGQGTLLASRLVGNVMIQMGLDVKVSEVHGMAQRGGSVVTYVRSGKEVASPIIEFGEADIILAFEQLEAARWLPYLKPGGKLILSSQKISPMPVITGAAKYTENIPEKLTNLGIDVTVVDAVKLASQAGSVKAVNVVLIGVLAKFFGIDRKIWETAIAQIVPSKFLELNLKAFELGLSQ